MEPTYHLPALRIRVDARHLLNPARYLDSAPFYVVPLAVDRQRGLQHRHLDAERRGGLAHDHAGPLAPVRRPGADRHQPPRFSPWPAGGRYRRHRRSTQTAHHHPRRYAGGGRCSGRAHPDGRHRTLDPPVADLRARPGRYHEWSSLAGHHARTGPQRPVACGHCSQLRRLQPGARHRTGLGWHCGGRHRRWRSFCPERYFLRRCHDRAVPVAARAQRGARVYRKRQYGDLDGNALCSLCACFARRAVPVRSVHSLGQRDLVAIATGGQGRTAPRKHRIRIAAGMFGNRLHSRRCDDRALAPVAFSQMRS